MALVNVPVEIDTTHVPRIRKAMEAITGIPDIIPGSEPPAKTPLKQLLSAGIQAMTVQQERSYTTIEPPSVT